MGSSPAKRILVVDDEKLVRWTVRLALQDKGYVVEEAATAAEGLRSVRQEAPDLMLLDFKLPDRDGAYVLGELKQIVPNMPVIMVTAFASIKGAVSAMREGAYDYIDKPFEMQDIVRSVERALETSQLRAELTRRRAEERAQYGLEKLVGRSSKMEEVREVIRKIGTSGATTILLLGESGVGKGLVARALHYESNRVDQAFMNIACTTLAPSLLESELFGHEKGAFTDAKGQKKGLLELAHGGTVFLDEIGDLPALVQGKLLGFLEEKNFRRVGGTRDIRVDVRVVAATNRVLKEAVEQGKFRSDLYYRLNVIPIYIPPLRERREDIPELIQHFLAFFNAEFSKSVIGFDEPAMDLIRAHTWPGNVRELRNAIERAVLLASDDLLTVRDLTHEVAAHQSGGTNGDFNLPNSGVVLDEIERSLVEQALERTGGNRTQAARLLGINRDQIRYRIEKYHLRVEGASEEEVPGTTPSDG